MINSRLIEARKQRRWSQLRVAVLIGTTQHNVSRWERGVTIPGAYFCAKLSALFGTSAEELGLVPASHSPVKQAESKASLSVEAVSLAQPPDSSRLWAVPYPRNPFFT